MSSDSAPLRRIPWPPVACREADDILRLEWLVTNGLGGYASGTVVGVTTRRYHGVLVAALPAPWGRMIMLAQTWESVSLPHGADLLLSEDERANAPFQVRGSRHLTEFRLELGLPVWRYEIDDAVLEKAVFMPYGQNTVHLTYSLLSASDVVHLKVCPWLNVRSLHEPVNSRLTHPYALTAADHRYEVSAGEGLPSLRLRMHATRPVLTVEPRRVSDVRYRVEESHGYEATGELCSPGYFGVVLAPEQQATLVASTETWDVIDALAPDEARAAEHERRWKLLSAALPTARQGPAAELVLAADQFVVAPATRVQDATRARATGDEARTVVAGYHWFTDWGRDTMISLEGLTLVTGRTTEAKEILRTFADHVRDGLIPNLFPEGEREGLYHTADATLWYFHAIDRYLHYTGDRATLALLLPKLRDIVGRHLEGTRFGIGVDAADGLVRQGQAGYQLTWMDAKVGDWVVTPRRGKAVEINALWYNALCLLAEWLADAEPDAVPALQAAAERARLSFNARFWYDTGGYLYDVVDGDDGRDDASCRPNQVVAIALRYPVLDPSRWKPVLDVVSERLLTPVGLRSLAPGHPDYKAKYFGDIRARDAAYHQGTVWAWLIGPFLDAWLRQYPDDGRAARQCLDGLIRHLGEACVGSISEIFDAEPPYHPRGCIAQAWSVAETLRSLLRTM